MNDWQKHYHIKKYHSDKQFKIKTLMRTKINAGLNDHHFSERIVELLGLDCDRFKEYISSKFQPGMSWNERSKWHLDHIVPTGMFDLTNEIELKKCYNYINLQPIWAHDNRIKAKKVNLTNVESKPTTIE
jgi:hypothetical protein